MGRTVLKRKRGTGFGMKGEGEQRWTSQRVYLLSRFVRVK